MTELVKAESLHPFARLVEVNRYFNFNLNLFSFPLLRSHYLDIGGCENASLNGSWIQITADKHVSNPRRLPFGVATGEDPIRILGVHCLLAPRQQVAGEHFGHRNRRLGCFRLGFMNVPSNPSTSDVDAFLVPIHISPLESRYLAVANSGCCVQDNHCLL